MSKEKVLTKKDLRKAAWRWLIGISTFNYETQLAPSTLFSVYPCLRKMYPDDEDLKKSCLNYMRYYNTMPWISPFVIGAALGIEDEGGISSLDAVNDFKVGLMGPLAGIGDTLFHVIPSTIIGSIASYMALEGSPLALVLWIFFGLLRLFCMKNFYAMGYREGAKIVSEIGNRLKKITKAANILGITVIGALIPSVVNARFAYEFSWGEVSISIQELADKIMPSLAPTLVVFFAYWMLGRKKMNSTRVTLLLVLVGILAYNLKVFA